jgi:hypothetical protein
VVGLVRAVRHGPGDRAAFRNGIARSLAASEVAAKLRDALLMDLQLAGPAQFRPFFQEKVRVWGGVIRENGLRSSG